MAYLRQVDTVLRAVLDDPVWETLVAAKRSKSRTKHNFNESLGCAMVAA